MVWGQSRSEEDHAVPNLTHHDPGAPTGLRRHDDPRAGRAARRLDDAASGRPAAGQQPSDDGALPIAEAPVPEQGME